MDTQKPTLDDLFPISKGEAIEPEKEPPKKPPKKKDRQKTINLNNRSTRYLIGAPRDKSIPLKYNPQERERWEKAQKKAGDKDLTTFIRIAVEKECRYLLKDEGIQFKDLEYDL